MSEDSFRSVQIERTSVGNYVARNVRGGSMSLGTGEDTSFTPVELLLAAIAGCTAVDVDYITSRRAEPTQFSVEVTGDKIRDETGGNRMQNIRVEFTVTFPEGADGDRAREALPRSLQQSHDRLCTVSRTVELGSPVSIVETGGSSGD
ncbi:OsmC family protein [Micromonospora zamorensis]|uniref:OsmC family protein n=2 Tax=Micromonospora TaxID=1873 RepID=A0ABZ1PMI3_9ACTN|nr:MULTISPECIES: OsmC family protein [Micromonospora]MBQ0978007.1 OsmC family protein [Micromonospora sp. M61]MBQ1037289.1 OsmC family protein [Micromonospora sp. C81]NYH40507.1 putative OsmC-like protein [Micromonospora jinlongensis]WSK48213.1 OsmC family protein [Micromonospora zamorensis]WTE89036.1 OsmC family protein [Micromonospora zamorensis]